MIALLSASAIFLAGLQAGINVPRNAFRECLKATAAKAASEKIGADAYQAYLESACEAQSAEFRSASIRFDMKNGMSRKDANATADELIKDWLDSSIETYAYRAERSAPLPAAAAAAAPKPATATPAAAPKQ